MTRSRARCGSAFTVRTDSSRGGIASGAIEIGARLLHGGIPLADLGETGRRIRVQVYRSLSRSSLFVGSWELVERCVIARPMAWPWADNRWSSW